MAHGSRKLVSTKSLVDVKSVRAAQHIVGMCETFSKQSAKKQTRGIKFPVSTIKDVLRGAYAIMMARPMLLQVQPPVQVCGDLHGQFPDLLRILRKFDVARSRKSGWNVDSKEAAGDRSVPGKLLFLGDYVDRGKFSTETMMLLFSLMVLEPNRVFLLRGNHETKEMNDVYGFRDEMKRRYTLRLWRTFLDCFAVMPVAAVVGFYNDEHEQQDKHTRLCDMDDPQFSAYALCMHGGISPYLMAPDYAEVIRGIKRPTDVPEEGVLCDLLWSDPSSKSLPDGLFGKSDRGVSYVFSAQALCKFIELTGLQLVIRAHEVVEEGYRFFAGRRLATVFSAPHYCDEFENKGAVVCISRKLVCSIWTIA